MATKKTAKKSTSVKADSKSVELNLRSAHSAIGAILSNIGKVKGAIAAFDRGFDRTSPGYDKFYDRDRNIESMKDKLINPADVIKDININK